MRFLLLFIAAVISVFAGVMALQLSSKNSAPPPAASADHVQPVSTVDVLVARNPIPAGTILTKEMLDAQPWPENLVLKGFIVSNGPEANIVGRVARSSFQAREPLISTKLANVKDAGFLAAQLPTGMRAVTIATDTVSGVAGFIYPADHVDVLFTHNVPRMVKATANESGANNGPAYSEILVPNVRVLAINLRDPANKEDAQPTAASVAPSSITLEVSAVDAENIRLAEKVGTLSVSLRSIQDAEVPTVTPPADLSGITHVQLSDAPMVEDDTVKVTRR